MNNLFYSHDHEWLRVEDTEATIGITDFAAGELGDIVYVDFLEIGSVLAKGQVFGTIEAVKTVSDLFMPVSGKIIGMNPQLTTAPESVNIDPFGDGWLVRIIVEKSGELDDLLDADGYQKIIGK